MSTCSLWITGNSANWAISYERICLGCDIRYLLDYFIIVVLFLFISLLVVVDVIVVVVVVVSFSVSCRMS